MSEPRGEVAAVFSVGTTAGGCEFALRWILNERQDHPEIYFFYGEAERGQNSAPLSAVHSLLSNSEFANLPRGEQQATHAFSLDRAYADAVELVRKIESRGYRRVYLGITGGTNPMVAAVFHAALAELTGEVIPVYVQGSQGPGGQPQSIEVVTGARSREAIHVERALALCRRGQLVAAKGSVESLAEQGRSGFLRRAVVALTRWDNFEYAAVEDIRRLAERAGDFADDPVLDKLAGTVQRYAKLGRHLADMEAIFSRPEEFHKARTRRSWPDEVRNRAVWLPIDALANSWRRLQEGRATDAVMRAYRAGEIAVHCRLFAVGVHPSALAWAELPLASVAEAWRRERGALPDVVAFEEALELLSHLSGEDFSDIEEERRHLQSCRNSSYLEHGYQRVTEAAGEHVLRRANHLVERILWGEETTGRLQQLIMVF